jgi:F-type H+-transporting ATPase subunit alpha
VSVSRVGSSAQTKAMKSVAGTLKLDLAQFRSLQAFAQFGTSDLDAATRRQLERGQRATELLKQPQFSPLSLSEEVAVVFALNQGFLDNVPIDKVRSFADEFRKFLASNHAEIIAQIQSGKVLTPEIEESLRGAVATFKQTVPF